MKPRIASNATPVKKINCNNCLAKAAVFLALAMVGLAEDNNVASSKAPTALTPLTVEEYKNLLPAKDNEIGAPELLKLLKKGPVVLLDVRSRESYAQLSTPGKKGRFSPTNSNVNNPPIKN